VQSFKAGPFVAFQTSPFVAVAAGIDAVLADIERDPAAYVKSVVVPAVPDVVALGAT